MIQSGAGARFGVGAGAGAGAEAGAGVGAGAGAEFQDGPGQPCQYTREQDPGRDLPTHRGGLQGESETGK